jgi:hypothetical protein
LIDLESTAWVSAHRPMRVSPPFCRASKYQTIPITCMQSAQFHCSNWALY